MSAPSLRLSIAWPSLALIGVTLAACSSVQTRTLDRGEVTMTEEQFAAHVEHVFRYHNKVMNDFITHATDLSDEDEEADTLGDAEEEMDTACEPLNEIASAAAMAEGTSFWTKRKLPQAVPECEAATQHLELLLREAFEAKQKHHYSLDDSSGAPPE